MFNDMENQILEFIKKEEGLDGFPFIIVFAVLCYLQEKGFLKLGDEDVEKV